jgi:hypothetical protein
MATHGGHYFLSAGTGKGAVYVFLIPAGGDAEPGTWDVAWCTKDPYDAVDGKRGDVTEHRGVSLDAAFAWGEDLALELSSKSLFAVNTLSKAVQWRKEPPSQSQRDYARRLRIADRITEGMSKGDVARLIDVEVGSADRPDSGTVAVVDKSLSVGHTEIMTVIAVVTRWHDPKMTLRRGNPDPRHCSWSTPGRMVNAELLVRPCSSKNGLNCDRCLGLDGYGSGLLKTVTPPCYKEPGTASDSAGFSSLTR